MTLSRSTFFGVFLTAVVLAPVAWAAEDAYAILNDIRAAAGLAPLSHDARLEAAALGHARYLVANDSASHDQSPGGRKFTGERPAQRAVAAGYASRLVSENLSKGDDRVLGSLQGLMAAIYHRFGFLDPEMTHIGIGVSGEGIETGMVYLMGNNALESLCGQEAPRVAGRFVLNACADDSMILEEDFRRASLGQSDSANRLILWPPPGAGNIPPAFYEESPDPVPDLSSTGYPVSVQVNTSQVSDFELLDFSLRDLDNDRPIKNARLLTHQTDPNGKFEPGQFALFPIERLRWGGQYEARLSMRLDGDKVDTRWRFETRPLSPRPIVIRGRDERLSVVSGEAINLVIETDPFQPVLSDLRYRHATDVQASVERPDANTLHIKAVGPPGRTIKFYSDNGSRFELLLRQY